MTAKTAENVAEQGMKVLIFFLVEAIILKIWRDRRLFSVMKILELSAQENNNDNVDENLPDPGIVRGFLDMVLLRRFIYTLYPAQITVAVLACSVQAKFAGAGLEYIRPMLIIVAIQMFAVTAICHPSLGTGRSYREWMKVN